MPCGACREFLYQLNEENENMEIMVNYETRETVTLKELMPNWWGKECYADAAAKLEAVFSWNGKTADKLFLAVHGNTKNGETAREDWEPVLAGKSQWRKHWRQYRMKVIRKSSVVVFLPDVICFCGRLHFPLYAVNG